MAKYKLQEMSDMRDEGKRRVYPKMVPYRTLSRKEFVEQMQSFIVTFLRALSKRF